jgi:hypothetical protein
MRIRSLSILGLLAAASAARAADPTPEQLAFFESKIRPVLSEKCYKCHSIEQSKAKGGLVLDTKEGLLKGGDSGPGVKPGNVDGSLLIKAILYTDSDLQMPPKGEKLSDQEIANLTSWVKMGAPDPRLKAKGGKLSGLSSESKKHWAFQPVKKPEIPRVKNVSWCLTPVDAFIMEKLEEKGMAPSPTTDKDTLLRRATYDLTGLPPTLEEIYAFRNDPSPLPLALNKVIDRLLASPHYGERWGRFWLDTARYADTTGQRGERGEDYRYPYAYTYRDWVINAVNADLPYDQFITQQLAADKIPNNPTANLAALGFLTVGEKFRDQNDIINDRIDVVSKGFVGLTVSCARCHDHMFDPIPTKDYYALHGVFSSTIEPEEKPVLNKVDPKLKAEFLAKIAAIEQANRDKYYKLIGDSSAEFRSKAGYYTQAAWARRREAGEEETKAGEKVVLEQKLDVNVVQELRKHAKPGSPVYGPLIELLSAGNTIKETAAGFATKANNGIHPLIAAGFKGSKVETPADAVAVYNKLFAGFAPQAKEIITKLASAKSASASNIDSDLMQFALAPFVDVKPASELDTEGLREVAQRLPLQLQGRARFDFAKVNELKLTHDGSEACAMVVADAPSARNSPVFIRGQAQVRGDVVPRSFLELFSGGKREPFKDPGSGRLELAQAIANKNNPLTARVMVNRVWMHHFGQAFVRTPDDLGVKSEAPSHQELMDYLSWYFVEQGWSLKKLHKLIMLSKVYHESSYTIKEQETLDPENRYLWRANVRRLDFEAFRDSLLVMSGQLDRTLGGQPVNLTDEPYSYRRSVYGYIDRGNLPELMQNFDFSSPEMPNSARTTTIVPQQALFLMNSPMAVDVARHVIGRQEVVSTPAGADFNRVQKIYEIIYQRAPKPHEIKMAISFVSGELAKQAATVKTMKDIAAKAQMNAEKKQTTMMNSSDAMKAIQNEGQIIERRPLSPWETYAQALMFSNEASYIN